MGMSLKGLIAEDSMSPVLPEDGMSTPLKGECHSAHTNHLVNTFIIQDLLHNLLQSAVS